MEQDTVAANTTLELKGDLTIAEVATIHEQIVSALASNNGTIGIDAAGVDTIDAAGLQLLIAAQKSGARVSSMSSALEKVAETLGLTDSLALNKAEVS